MDTRACSKCGVVFPHSAFQHFKGRPSGQCRTCKTEAEQKRRRSLGASEQFPSALVAGGKVCRHCHTTKPLDAFSKSVRGSGGVAAYCKVCSAERARKNPEVRRKATAQYRERHRERWRALHRLSSFKRRHLKEASSDGTVTDDFLKTLYSSSTCHYCAEEIEVGDRTADHKIPLSRGGAHSAGNLVMACFTCNSRKSALTEEEFIERTKNDNLRQSNR